MVGSQDIKMRGLIEEILTTSRDRARQNNRFSPDFRKCSKVQDEDLFFMAVKRVLGHFESGRAFLEELSFEDESILSKSAFFESLKSRRRAEVIRMVSEASFSQFEKAAADSGIDYLKEFPELDNYNVMNGDGHYFSHASHTKPLKEKTSAAGSVYIQSLRSGNIFPLAVVSDGSIKAHEMPVFKKATQDMPADFYSRKYTLWVMDRGFISNEWWGFQRRKGHYFITRTKSNFAPEKMGSIPFDKTDPVNKGVTDYYLAGLSSSWLFQMVDYTDPETNEKYTFITSLDDFDLRPGLIAWLYFKRWNIEKSFDNAKNTLHEKKAWANGREALTIQSHAIAFAYNVMRMFHEMLIHEEKADEGKTTLSEKKYLKWLGLRQFSVNTAGRSVHPLCFTERMARIPSAFARCFRSCF